ncbi:hypothetical protein LINPERHAP2_LOCUS812 [Linum perenne]
MLFFVTFLGFALITDLCCSAFTALRCLSVGIDPSGSFRLGFLTRPLNTLLKINGFQI